MIFGKGRVILIAAGFVQRARHSSSYTSEIRFKNNSGKMYVLKSAASTGPRRMLAASQRWLSRFPRSTTADVFKQALHCRDGPAQCS